MPSRKLPTEPTVEKAVWSRDTISFGTLYTSPKGVLQPFERDHHDVLEMIMTQGRGLVLAEGWSVETLLYTTEGTTARYAQYAFVREHGYWGHTEKVHPAILSLVSGFLLLNEYITFENFMRYVRLQGLKYLPFVVTKKDYKFFVYDPTPQRVQQAITRLDEVLATIESTKLWDVLPQTLQYAYALVRLDEVQNVSHHIRSAHTSIREGFYGPLHFHRRDLGFLYQDLPGSQDAVTFDYDMYK